MNFSELKSLDARPAGMPEELLEKIALEIDSRGMRVPAIFLFEMYKPLTSLLHAGTLFCAPLIWALGGQKMVEPLQQILESRTSLEALIVKLESLSEMNRELHGRS